MQLENVKDISHWAAWQASKKLCQLSQRSRAILSAFKLPKMRCEGGNFEWCTCECALCRCGGYSGGNMGSIVTAKLELVVKWLLSYLFTHQPVNFLLGSCHCTMSAIGGTQPMRMGHGLQHRVSQDCTCHLCSRQGTFVHLLLQLGALEIPLWQSYLR